MASLAEVIHETRTVREHDPTKFVSSWTEKEVLDGEVVDAFVLILRTRGCYWARKSGCSMCGYTNDCFTDVSEEDLLKQWSQALKVYGKQPVVKVYNSGSFFDPNEVPPRIRTIILKDLGRMCQKVVVESLPQLVRRPVLEEAVRLCERFEVAIGLETANDFVRDRCISKDFHFDRYLEAVKVARRCGVSVKTYLLMKPPFLSERAAMVDVVASARAIDGHTDTVSINPTNVQRDTLVDRLYRKGEYRPPWLWSLVEVLKELRKSKARVMSKPTGGGKRRGAHNCGHCDWLILKAVEEYSLGISDWLDELDCECREDWENYLLVEDMGRCSVNLERFLS
ncbi:MAG: archaeosine biosynthesis radical SAM protein RaSEA [Thermoplasmata archaeon]